MENRGAWLAKAFKLTELLRQKKFVSLKDIEQELEVSYKGARRWMKCASEYLPVTVEFEFLEEREFRRPRVFISLIGR